MTAQAVEEAREILDEQVTDLQARAKTLGHDVHPFAPMPKQGLCKRTACRKCGRPLRVRVIPGGTFTDVQIIRTAWIDFGVACKR